MAFGESSAADDPGGLFAGERYATVQEVGEEICEVAKPEVW